MVLRITRDPVGTSTGTDEPLTTATATATATTTATTRATLHTTSAVADSNDIVTGNERGGLRSDRSQPTGLNPGSGGVGLASTPRPTDQGFDVQAVDHEPAPPSATPTPPSYDVATLSDDDLSALRRTNPRLAATIMNARTNYADLLAAGAKVVALTSAGNGNEPVLVVVGPGFDPGQPARAHTHYHGWSATVADPLGHSSGAPARLRQVLAADPQTVFVLPECRNSPAEVALGTVSYSTNWSNVSNQATTTADALAAAGITEVGTTVVSAHSGGGSALNSIAAKNTPRTRPATAWDGTGLTCDRLELYDCFYGSEATVSAWAGTANGRAAADVTYLRGTNDAGRDAGVARAFGTRYHRIEVGRETGVPTSANPVITDGAGRPRGPRGNPFRHYPTDAHNRAVGQFMGLHVTPAGR